MTLIKGAMICPTSIVGERHPMRRPMPGSTEEPWNKGERKRKIVMRRDVSHGLIVAVKLGLLPSTSAYSHTAMTTCIELMAMKRKYAAAFALRPTIQ